MLASIKNFYAPCYVVINVLFHKIKSYQLSVVCNKAPIMLTFSEDGNALQDVQEDRRNVSQKSPSKLLEQLESIASNKIVQNVALAGISAAGAAAANKFFTRKSKPVESSPRSGTIGNLSKMALLAAGASAVYYASKNEDIQRLVQTLLSGVNSSSSIGGARSRRIRRRRRRRSSGCRRPANRQQKANSLKKKK